MKVGGSTVGGARLDSVEREEVGLEVARLAARVEAVRYSPAPVAPQLYTIV